MSKDGVKSVNVGIIGFGTVGSGVVKILIENRDLINKRLGGEITIKRIASTPKKTEE